MLLLKSLGVLGPVLASRPTLVANQLHCTAVRQGYPLYLTQPSRRTVLVLNGRGRLSF